MDDGGKPKVVRIDDDEQSRSRLSQKDSIHLLNDCRDRAKDRLSAATPNLFTRIDDLLFDLASKLDEESVRQRYFEVMNDLRLKKPAISEEFIKQFIEGFSKKARSRDESEDILSLNSDELELSLVDDSDLEESLAVTNAVSSISNACQEELFALDRRMEVLLNKTDLETADNPLGPGVVCYAFQAACKVLDSGGEVKLIIFKSFERIIGPDLEDLYQEINQYLLEKGVLPKIRTGFRQHSRRPPAPGIAAGPSAASEEFHGHDRSHTLSDVDMQDVFSAMQQLMGVQPSGGGGGGGGGGVGGADGAARGSPGHTPEILRSLTMIQQGDVGSIPGELPAFDPGALSAGNVNVLRDLKSTVFAEGLGEMDAMTLDVVSMLFDFILDDKNVPSAMQALIGRLQIPVLKAAMLDKSIFSKRTHPVRKLLDTLAEAAIGWNEEHGQNDPLYVKVDGMVHRLLEEFQDDLSIFPELLAELEDFLAEQRTETEEQAEESAQATEGRERLAMAAAMAQDEVGRRLESGELPQPIHDFLRNTWRELMSLTYLKDGDESEEWKAVIETMDALIESVSPKPTPEERRALVSKLPGLIKRLNVGIKLVSMPEVERDRFLSVLAALHASVVRTGSPELDWAHLPPADEQDAAAAAAVWGELEAGHSRRARLFREAFEKANEAIYRAAQNRPECTGMGTTLVAALFSGDGMTVAHIGDSRLYRLRDGQFEQVTKDHSLLQQLVDQGFYTPEQAKKSNKKNYVTRAMGVDTVVDLELHEQPVVAGDIYLLCSDGLSDLVEPETIHLALQTHENDLETAAQNLVRLANDAGGKDNISVILARVLEPLPADVESSGPVSLSKKLEIHSASDVGRKRSNNEDYVGSDSEVGMALLADGMGGYNAGEVASALAVNMIMEDLRASLGFASVEDRVTEEGDALLEELLADASAGEEESAEITDEYTDLVENLQVGAWIEFRRGEDNFKRGRLTWISPSGSIYLFTDHQGAKVADATPTGLALELRRGTAAVLEDEPLFDRAVSDVMSQLKHSTPPPA